MKFNFNMVINDPDDTSVQIANIGLSFDATAEEYINLIDHVRECARELHESVMTVLPPVMKIVQQYADLKLAPEKTTADPLSGLKGMGIPVTGNLEADIDNAVKVTGLPYSAARSMLEKVYALKSTLDLTGWLNRREPVRN